MLFSAWMLFSISCFVLNKNRPCDCRCLGVKELSKRDCVIWVPLIFLGGRRRGPDKAATHTKIYRVQSHTAYLVINPSLCFPLYPRIVFGWSRKDYQSFVALHCPQNVISLLRRKLYGAVERYQGSCWAERPRISFRFISLGNNLVVLRQPCWDSSRRSTSLKVCTYLHV